MNLCTQLEAYQFSKADLDAIHKIKPRGTGNDKVSDNWSIGNGRPHSELDKGDHMMAQIHHQWKASTDIDDKEKAYHKNMIKIHQSHIDKGTK